MVQSMGNGGEGSFSGPHRMRITPGGDVSGYVNFALTFLKEQPTRSLMLHTLPAESPSKQRGAYGPQQESGPSKMGPGAGGSGPLTPVLLATPKLISVVEKIKREYMAFINTSDQGKGKNNAVGIWQYNESGSLSGGGAEQEKLGMDSVLEGRKRPKMVHRPYLQITLSTRPLGLEEGSKGRNVTCQYIIVRRRKSKSQKRTPTANSTEADPVPIPQPARLGRVEMTKAGRDGDKAVKRKAEGSQASEAARGKKRKKQGADTSLP